MKVIQSRQLSAGSYQLSAFTAIFSESGVSVEAGNFVEAAYVVQPYRLPYVSKLSASAACPSKPAYFVEVAYKTHV